jgi:hypothetical protein
MNTEVETKIFCPSERIDDLGQVRHALMYPKHQNSTDLHSGLKTGLIEREFRVGLELSFLVADMFQSWKPDRFFAERVSERMYQEPNSSLVTKTATSALNKLVKPTKGYYRDEVKKVMDKSMNLRSFALWFHDQLEFCGYAQPVYLEFLRTMSDQRNVQQQKYKLYEL